jgi:predicted ATPase
MAKVVIAGGPCSGKTTLVAELEKQGFKIIHEAARALITEQRALNSELLPDRNKLAFQLELLRRQLENEKLAESTEDFIFIDCGIPEDIAYFEVDKEKAPEQLWHAAKTRNYSHVFLLEQNPVFVKDGLRLQDREQAQNLSKLIETVYQRLGYKVHRIPFASLNKRIELIKKVIDDNGQG